MGLSGKGSLSLVNAGARGIVVNDAGGGMTLELGGHCHQAHLSRGLTTVVAVDLTIVTVAAMHCHSHYHLHQQSVMRVRKMTYHNLSLSSLLFTSSLFMLELG